MRKPTEVLSQILHLSFIADYLEESAVTERDRSITLYKSYLSG